ncbi:hypothetical protein FA95DRAFT_1565383 [Auriscalpium vulgare]|uniref:Uncharacterized protein n=1 Tax=Auriscalpium vulgare TaxID=40419 RepID=A0ACB8RCL4_9AGAM|nr:hypothetical protein FA95DRAFT_1565383 [Auriscalpium vulgare]
MPRFPPYAALVLSACSPSSPRRVCFQLPLPFGACILELEHAPPELPVLNGVVILLHSVPWWSQHQRADP